MIKTWSYLDLSVPIYTHHHFLLIRQTDSIAKVNALGRSLNFPFKLNVRKIFFFFLVNECYDELIRLNSDLRTQSTSTDWCILRPIPESPNLKSILNLKRDYLKLKWELICCFFVTSLESFRFTGHYCDSSEINSFTVQTKIIVIRYFDFLREILPY